MIIPFLNLKIDFLQDKIKYINIKLKTHLNAIIKKLYNFLFKNKHLLNKKVLYIFNNYNDILEDYNIILNDCMEWYICLLIEMYKYKTIIIHAGLYHTEKVNKLLNNYYNYNEIYKNGINYLNNNQKYECQPFNENIL